MKKFSWKVQFYLGRKSKNDTSSKWQKKYLCSQETHHLLLIMNTYQHNTQRPQGFSKNFISVECQKIIKLGAYFLEKKKQAFFFFSVWKIFYLFPPWFLNSVFYIRYLNFVNQTSVPPPIAEISLFFVEVFFFSSFENPLSTQDVGKNSKPLKK